MTISLIDKVRAFYAHQANKHGLYKRHGLETAEEYADMEINDMSNVELLQAISDALEE